MIPVKKNKTVWFIALGLLLLIGIFLITTYNSLVKKDEKVKLQWNEVQNAYQRRLNLIPNIVNVVKGVSEYEQTTLQQIAEARSKAASVNISSNNVSADDFTKQAAARMNWHLQPIT